MREPDSLAQWVRDSVGIPDRLIGSLAEDDDWTFVIKVHGLIEATLNQLLINELGNPSLETFLSRLETANERTGKIAVVKACGLLNPDACRFIRALSVLRNKLVHNIKNFDINIVQYGLDLTGNEGSDWRAGLKCGLFGLKEIEGLPVEEFVKQNPKTAIKLAMFSIMRDSFLHHRERTRPA